jgi:hypothetical protein
MDDSAKRKQCFKPKIALPPVVPPDLSASDQEKVRNAESDAALGIE